MCDKDFDFTEMSGEEKVRPDLLNQRRIAAKRSFDSCLNEMEESFLNFNSSHLSSPNRPAKFPKLLSIPNPYFDANSSLDQNSSKSIRKNQNSPDKKSTDHSSTITNRMSTNRSIESTATTSQSTSQSTSNSQISKSSKKSKSAIAKLKLMNFPDFDFSTNADEWLLLFENVLNECNEIEKALIIVPKYLDEAGLEFHERMRKIEGMNWIEYKAKFKEYFENLKSQKIESAISTLMTDVDEYLSKKIESLRSDLPELKEMKLSIEISSTKNQKLMTKIKLIDTLGSVFCQKTNYAKDVENSQRPSETISKDDVNSSFDLNESNGPETLDKNERYSFRARSEMSYLDSDELESGSEMNESNDEMFCPLPTDQESIDQAARDWLRSNYQKTPYFDRCIRVNSLDKNLNLHLKTELSREKIHSLVTDVFSPIECEAHGVEQNMMYLRLKRKRTESNETHQQKVFYSNQLKEEDHNLMVSWLKRNYETSEDRNHLIRSAELCERYSCHLKASGGKFWRKKAPFGLIEDIFGKNTIGLTKGRIRYRQFLKRKIDSENANMRNEAKERDEAIIEWLADRYEISGSGQEKECNELAREVVQHLKEIGKNQLSFSPKLMDHFVYETFNISAIRRSKSPGLFTYHYRIMEKNQN